MRVLRAEKYENGKFVHNCGIIVCVDSAKEGNEFTHGTEKWGEMLAEYGLEDRDVDVVAGWAAQKTYRLHSDDNRHWYEYIVMHEMTPKECVELKAL